MLEANSCSHLFPEKTWPWSSCP